MSEEVVARRIEIGVERIDKDTFFFTGRDGSLTMLAKHQIVEVGDTIAIMMPVIVEEGTVLGEAELVKKDPPEGG